MLAHAFKKIIITKMNNRIIYHKEALPKILEDAFDAPELLRLGGVGMHCGCEYTSFPIFKNLLPYSRREHSYGVMAIVYHFTHDIKMSLSGAFHDISTPCFSHSIDFLHKDYCNQEYTEGDTKRVIENSNFIQNLLKMAEIDQNDVNDYHLYPIADNDSPKLSADRLEYTCSNIVNFGFASKEETQELYDNLKAAKNEFGEDELCFDSFAKARRFADLALRNSKIYICKEDRFSMFALSSLLEKAIEQNIIDESNLMEEEPTLIHKLSVNPKSKKWWDEFRKLNCLYENEATDQNHFYIPAKKRFIDPYVVGMGRLSSIDAEFRNEVQSFLNLGFTPNLGHPSFFKALSE